MTMIERVARAIEACWDKLPFTDEAMEGRTPDDQYCEMARAAIEAMREPDEAMCAVEFKNDFLVGDDPTQLDKLRNRIRFQAMIDAALDA